MVELFMQNMKVPRSNLSANIQMNRTHRGRKAVGRRGRKQTGQGLISTFKKIAKHPTTKQLKQELNICQNCKQKQLLK